MKQQSTPHVLINSKLMQEYRIARPVSADKEIATVLNAGGQVQVFSIGNNGSVSNIHREADSDTGWTVTNMKFNARATHIAAGRNKDGSLAIFVSDTQNQLHVTTDVRSNAWQSAGSRSGEAIDMIRVGNRLDGTLVVSVLTNATTRPVLYDIGWDGATPGAWEEQAFVSKNCTEVYDYQIGFDNKGWTNQTGAAYFVIAKNTDNTPYHLFVNPLSELATGDWPYQDRVSAFALTTQPPDWTGSDKKASDVVLVKNEKILYIAFVGYPTNIAIGADVNTLEVAAGRQHIDIAEEGKTQDYYAQEVFSITRERKLYHFRSIKFGDWSEGIEIAAPLTFTHLSLTLDVEGNSQLFAVATDSRFYHIRQDPASTDWNIEEIEVPTGGEVEAISSYNTEITVADALQAPAFGKTVKIFSEGPVSLEINGTAALIDADTPWTGRTNISGKVVISDKTASLGTEALLLWTEGMPEQDRITVTASDPVQDELGAMTGTGLMAAKITADDGSQTDLLQGDYRNSSVADAMAQALRQSTSLARRPQPDAPGGRAAYLHADTDRRIARYWPEYDGRSLGKIDLAAVPEQHWSLDFTSGRPVFQSLFGEDAARLMAQRRETMPLLTGVAALNVGWGDIWGAIEAGVASIVSDVEDIVVSTVVDPVTKIVTEIKAQITVVIEELGKKVKYLFEQRIDLVRQALDIVEGAFAKVKVAFEDLYRWVGFIFNWNDILNTKAVLEYFSNQLLDGLRTWSEEGLKDVIRTQFDALQTKIATAFDTAEEIFAKGVSFNGVVTTERATSADSGPGPLYGSTYRKTYAQNSNSVNYVWNQMINDANAGTSSAPAQETGSPPDLQALIALIEEKLENNSALNDSLEKFNQWFSSVDDPQTFFNVAVLSLIESVKDVVVVVLEIIESILLALVDLINTGISAFKTLINTPIDNMPIVSALYRKIAQHDLTLLDLAALLAAVPATILYKIIFNEAPFTSVQAKWATPTNSYTPPRFTWPSLSADANSAMPRQTPALQTEEIPAFLFGKEDVVTTGALSPFLGVYNAVLDGGVWLLRTADAGDDYMLKFFEGPALVTISVANILFSSWMQLAVFPYASITKKPKSPGDDAAIASWAVNCIPILSDTVFTTFGWKAKGLTRFQGKFGPILTTVEGAVMLGVGIYAVIAMTTDEKYHLSPWSAVETIVAPLPFLVKAALLMGENPIAYGIVAGTDLVSGVAVAVTRIGSQLAQLKQNPNVA
jgi:hypothetical protein